MKPAVLTGDHFIVGDVACAEGALAAGCRFFGGYPITPATEIAEHMSARLPEVGGTVRISHDGHLLVPLNKFLDGFGNDVLML